MKNLIRKILKEETSNFNKFEMGAFKMIDRVGIEKFIDESLRHMGLTAEEEKKNLMIGMGKIFGKLQCNYQSISCSSG